VSLKAEPCDFFCSFNCFRSEDDGNQTARVFSQTGAPPAQRPPPRCYRTALRSAIGMQPGDEWESPSSVGTANCSSGEVLYYESGEVMEQLPREAVDAPSIPGGVQGQVGWGPGQPGLV